jgi:hypothetical protein
LRPARISHTAVEVELRMSTEPNAIMSALDDPKHRPAYAGY